MKNKLIFLIPILAGSLFFIVKYADEGNELPINNILQSHVKDEDRGNDIEADSLDTSQISNSSLAQKPQDSALKNTATLLDENESIASNERGGLASELIEIFGEGEVIPITDPEAQQRLFDKLGTDASRELNKKYNEAEYDPKYDNTWSTDIQGTAFTEINNHFPDNAFVEDYDCSRGSTCSLKISMSDGDRSFYSEAANFVSELRSTPAILKSGAKRDVLVSRIEVEENGNSVVELIIGNVDEIESSN